MHKHFTDDDIIIIFEDSAEYHSDSVFLCVDVPEIENNIYNGMDKSETWTKLLDANSSHGLIFAVMDDGNGPARFLIPLKLEVLLKDWRKAVTL